MKKLILLAALLSLASCQEKDVKGKHKEYVLVYRIHYSETHIVTRTVVGKESLEMGSDRGTNWVSTDYVQIERTSAPIEKVSYTYRWVY